MAPILFDFVISFENPSTAFILTIIAFMRLPTGIHVFDMVRKNFSS
jgi:hypothetical protein